VFGLTELARHCISLPPPRTLRDSSASTSTSSSLPAPSFGTDVSRLTAVPSPCRRKPNEHDLFDGDAMKFVTACLSQTSLRPPLRAHLDHDKRRPRAAAVLAVAAAVLASSALGPNAASAAIGQSGPSVGAAGTALDAAVGDVVAAGVPGILVRVQEPHRAARRLAAGVSDLATGAALRPTAQFRIGSITKTFVATAVLQLVGEGRLTLDEPVARRLPDLLANGDQITVRQLLNHTSGLADYTAHPELFAGIIRNRTWEPRELLTLAGELTQQFEPGAAWAYSNTNYIAAGLLIEAVTGRPLARELDRRIFSPLRLDHTSMPVATARLSGYYAHGYTSTDSIPTADGRPLDVTSYNPSHAWAAGAIVSSAADLSTFYRTLLGGGLLSMPLLREMQTTIAVDPTDPARTFSYGLGLWRVTDTCGANWGHTGAIFGYQTQAFWNERTDRTVVIASTMFPAPTAADAPLATVTELALCANTHAAPAGPTRQLPPSQGTGPAPAPTEED
jgi:D-alanyl-D-alanine carboxypeptidase